MSKQTTLLPAMLLPTISPRTVNANFNAPRQAYVIVLELDGELTEETHVYREQWITGAEAREILQAIVTCERVTDFRMRPYQGDARFDKGPGDLLRLICKINSEEPPDGTTQQQRKGQGQGQGEVEKQAQTQTQEQ